MACRTRATSQAYPTASGRATRHQPTGSHRLPAHIPASQQLHLQPTADFCFLASENWLQFADFVCISGARSRVLQPGNKIQHRNEARKQKSSRRGCGARQAGMRSKASLGSAARASAGRRQGGDAAGQGCAGRTGRTGQDRQSAQQKTGRPANAERPVAASN